MNIHCKHGRHWLCPIKYAHCITWWKLNRIWIDFNFKAGRTIDLASEQPASQVELNLLELGVWRCRLKADDDWRDCAFRIDPGAETLSISLPEARQGRFQLQIEYDGRINDQMAGFYRSGYQKAGRQKYIAVTQFQESSARQAFPCMDHPRYKATFDIVMTVPEAPAGHYQYAGHRGE